MSRMGMENLVLKVIALTLAVITWLYVNKDSIYR